MQDKFELSGSAIAIGVAVGFAVGLVINSIIAGIGIGVFIVMAISILKGAIPKPLKQRLYWLAKPRTCAVEERFRRWQADLRRPVRAQRVERLARYYQDIIDLYGRIPVGTKAVVLPVRSPVLV